MPSLSFGTFTALRDTAPSRRTRSVVADELRVDATGRAITTGAWAASFQQQLNKTQSDSNARGTFTFTGLYTAGGLATTRGSGQDFADFLLGLPQQATRQYSVTPDNISTPVTIRGRQFSLYVQDDWRWKARWTINYGLQYDFTAPYTETSGHMVNLDAAPDFTAVAPVLAGAAGPYSGLYGAGAGQRGLEQPGATSRRGLAREQPGRRSVRLRAVVQQRVVLDDCAQSLPAAAVLPDGDKRRARWPIPLALTDAFANITPSTVTNNYGIEKDYQLGLIHQWTADYSRNAVFDVERGRDLHRHARIEARHATRAQSGAGRLAH